LFGANFKLGESTPFDEHAEDIVTGKARRYGYNLLSFMAIVGDPQPDHASGQTPATLHPCGRCRDRLGSSGLITARTTFISATADLRTIQVYGYDGLTEYHANGNENGLTTITLGEDFADWDEVAEPVLRARLLGTPKA
jgi:hypothetical protein